MKKSIISPICSALVVPGLGQILNQEIKKGIILLAIVFVLIISGTVTLTIIINSLLNNPYLDSASIIEHIYGENSTSLRIIAAISFIVWIYSIIDAFMQGFKLDRKERETS